MNDDPRNAAGKKALKAALGGAATGAASGLATGSTTGVVLGAGFGMLGGTGRAVVEAVVEGFRGATERLEEAAEIEKARALEEASEDLSARIDLLRDTSRETGDFVSNIRAIVAAWSRAYDTAGDSKKRRVIMAALGHAFDQEMFEEGLTVRLFQVLETLDYPEVQFLRTSFDQRGTLKRLVQLRTDLKAHKTQDHHRLKAEAAAEFAPGTKGHELCTRLEEQRLTLCPSSSDLGKLHSSITWLGRRLIRLCQDTETLAKRWPESHAAGDTEPG